MRASCGGWATPSSTSLPSSTKPSSRSYLLILHLMYSCQSLPCSYLLLCDYCVFHPNPVGIESMPHLLALPSSSFRRYLCCDECTTLIICNWTNTRQTVRLLLNYSWPNRQVLFRLSLFCSISFHWEIYLSCKIMTQKIVFSLFWLTYRRKAYAYHWMEATTGKGGKTCGVYI
jgi:hypothetical protein